MAFKYLDEEMINKLIASLIRSKLEHAAMIWSPIDKIGSKPEKFILWRKTFKAKTTNFWEKREKEDFIAVYRASKGLEKIDRDDLFVWDNRTRRRHEKKLKKD